jgi:hypothetical protein
MAYASFGPFFSRKAAADFRETEFRAVKLNAQGELILAEEGDMAVGILTDDRDGTTTDTIHGEHATYQYRDICKWTAGDEVSVGDLVGVGEDGKAVSVEAGYVMGIAMESGVADQIISVQLGAMMIPSDD